MNSTSLTKPVDLQGLSLALAKTKADYEAQIDNVINTSLKTINIWFENTSGIGAATVGTASVGDENLISNTSYQLMMNEFNNNNNNTLIYFHYYNYHGQAFLNNDLSFSATCFKSNDLEQTEGIKIIYKSNGTITSSRFYVPVPEDDINILNLLSGYDLVSPISDAFGNVIVDVDGNLILG